MTPPVLIVGFPGPLTERVAAGVANARVVHGPEGLAAALGDGDTPDGAVVVYLAQTRDPFGLEPFAAQARRLFDLCAGAAVDHLVLVSSAAVHEPSAHHLNMVGEGRLASRWTGNPLPDRWQALETAAEERLGEAGRLTILRPAPVVTPGGRDFWSRLLRRRVALTVLGHDPTVQLLSADDLAAAVARVVEARPGGVYNLAPAGNVPLHKALKHAGVVRLPVPAFLQVLVRRVLAPLGLSAPAGQVDYLRFPFTVSGAKIRRQLGVTAGRSSVRAAREVRGPVDDPQAAEPTYDPWGLDVPYIRFLSRFLFPFLHDAWWRVEVRGLHRLPREGGVVLTGVHRGFQPWDGVMGMYLIARELGRYIRFLVHPTLIKFPFLAPYMIRLGGIPACQENGDWVLRQGEVLAIFPEGIRGAFRMYDERIYELGKFGRDEFVRFALRHQVPIVPYVTVGSAEIYPIYGKIKWGWWKRLSEWPFLPVTPTMGTIPLPSKWHTHFLEPLHVEREHPPEAADDKRIVRAISREVRERMTAALQEMLERRRRLRLGRWRGDIWSDEERGADV